MIFQLQNVLVLNKNYEESDVWEKLWRIWCVGL